MLTIRRGAIALSLAALLASSFAVSASADNSDQGFLPPSVEGINPHPGQLDGGQGGTNGGSQGAGQGNQGEGGQNEHDGSGSGNGNPKGGATALGYYGASTISYHVGAPVMNGGINVYAIYYGNWEGAATAAVANNSTGSIIGSGATAVPAYQSHSGNRDLINSFLGSIGGTSHFNINSGYYSQASSTAAKTFIQNSVTFKASTTTFLVGTSKKTTLSDTDIKTVVSSAIAANTSFQVNGKPDPNGIYYVFTSAGISESSGFLSRYCGWHSAATINTVTTKYSFVGDPSKSIATCAGQSANSPHSSANNNLVAGDAMVSVIVHELEETATDPQLNAWYDTSGYENGDKCAWTFGTATSVTPAAGVGLNTTAYSYNYSTVLGGVTHNWLLQQNWQITASPQSCVISQ
jgi:hypothetical protein